VEVLSLSDCGFALHNKTFTVLCSGGQWSANDLQGFVPASVQYEDDKILFLGTGPPLVSAQGASAEEFWKYIRSWGGEWLWEHVSTPCGLDEVVDAVAAGSAILMTDGSYSRNISEIDGAGWLM
jgi:hypothetical protein